MTVSDALRLFVDELAMLYPANECRSIGKLYIGSKLGFNNADFLTKGNALLDSVLGAELMADLMRLKTGEPIQYVLQRAWFMDLELEVGPGVLIPRPETEELVQWVTDDYKLSAPNVLDIGTGSGCIALGIAHGLKNAHVSAWDVSADALAIAARNAVRTNLNVDFHCVDVLNLPIPLPTGPCDVIVSNPPYVTLAEKDKMHVNVLNHEPHVALFVEDHDALLFYRTIATLGRRLLKPNGRLYFEINEALGQVTVDLLGALGYTHIELRADLQGKHRMVRADL